MAVAIPIDVCIPTFRRPRILAELLASLAAQQLEGITMRLIVIDNDQQRSALETVDAFRASHPFEVVYDVEPCQNISLARNRAISHVRADYLAFVDDDEVVSSQWLRHLLDSLNRFSADVALAPVLSILPEDAPDWSKKMFNRPRFPTGTPRETGGAGNVMLRRAVVADGKVRFDPGFGTTGGEDTDFFYRLHLLGRRTIWCDEAWASEPVPAARLTLDWIRRRGFRGGQTYTRVFVSRFAAPRKWLWMIEKTLQIAAGLLAAPFVRMISYPSYVALTVRLAGASGQLSYCFSGAHFEEYSLRNYR